MLPRRIGEIGEMKKEQNEKENVRWGVKSFNLDTTKRKKETSWENSRESRTWPQARLKNAHRRRRRMLTIQHSSNRLTQNEFKSAHSVDTSRFSPVFFISWFFLIMSSSDSLFFSSGRGSFKQSNHHRSVKLLKKIRVFIAAALLIYSLKSSTWLFARYD